MGQALKSALFFIFEIVGNNWLNKLRDFIKNHKWKDDRRLVIFLVCVGIASSFWFLNALNKDYKVEISFPVRYTNLPNNKVLSTAPPSHLTLEVNAHGFSILRHKLSLSFSPLVFNVNDFTNKVMEKNDKARYAISSRQFSDDIADQISNELIINRIWPDTVYFNFDKIVKKMVQVKANVDIDLKNQYYLNGAIFTRPDSVLVSGPQSVLDTIDFIHTNAQSYTDVDQSIQRNVSLEEFDHLKLQTKRVVLNIPIEEYTQKEMEIPITIENLPDSLKINLFPAKVKLNFMTSLSSFNDIGELDFKLIVSYQDIMLNQEKLTVSLTEMPANLQVLTFLPKEVEYLIEK